MTATRWPCSSATAAIKDGQLRYKCRFVWSQRREGESAEEKHWGDYKVPALFLLYVEMAHVSSKRGPTGGSPGDVPRRSLEHCLETTRGLRCATRGRWHVVGYGYQRWLNLII